MSKTDPVVLFQQDILSRTKSLARNKELRDLSIKWMLESGKEKWSYNFNWFGRPAIQFPNDAWAMQEIIWEVKPDLIIECGVAHGGSLIYYASLLALLEVCDSIQSGTPFDPGMTKRKVLGLDIDIREHNRVEIERHPMAKWIQTIQGSSISENTISTVRDISKNYTRILVSLDSNHTHQHVLRELEAYADLVTKGSYCVVFDTVVEDMPLDLVTDRPWGPGNSPKTAVWEYLKKHPEFEIDENIHNRLMITVAPDGYLKRIA
jgi:cephalosporin hydroxylase